MPTTTLGGEERQGWENQKPASKPVKAEKQEKEKGQSRRGCGMSTAT
jgi:hypothetical protein